MQINYERFYLWFNKIFCSLFYLRHQGKTAVVVNAQGGAQFWVRVNTFDLPVIWEIWNAKVYDDKQYPILEENVVVDIGAHIGAFAVRAARLAHRGRVYGYEASGKNYAWLSKNRELNQLENLYIENCAIANQRGEMRLYMPAENGIMGSLVQNTSSFVETVQTKTLEGIIAEHNIQQIDVLKMDVEGAEYDILLGCTPETLAKVRRIVLEYHDFEADQRSHSDLVSLLIANGFKVLIEGGMVPQAKWFGTGIKKVGILKAWRE